MPEPLEDYEIAELYLGPREAPGGLWPDLPKNEVFSSGDKPKHTTLSIAFEAAGRYVLYTVDVTKVSRSRGLWGECVVLNPDPDLADTNKVVVADRFTEHRYRMDVPQLRHWILEGGAKPAVVITRFLQQLRDFAVHNTDAFIASLHPPAGAGVDTRLSVPSVSGGQFGRKRSH